MKIGIDVSPLYMGVSGISNYIRNLLHGFSKCGGEHRYVLYTNRPVEVCLPRNFAVRVVRLPLPKMQAWFQIGLPIRLLKDGVDVFLGPFHRLPLLSKVPSVLTVHDLSGLVMKEYHKRGTVMRNSLMPLFIRRARRVIADSGFTGSEIARLFPWTEDRLDVVPLAPSSSIGRVDDAAARAKLKEEFDLPDRFVLFVGTLEPRKNLPGLLRAFASIAGRIPHDLVLTGNMGWKSGPLLEILENVELRHRVRLTGFVSDDCLSALYSMAEIMIYPSFYEGFGLPVVEAMACGTPVITSNVSSLPEAAGGAALLVDPSSREDIAEKLLLLCLDDGLRLRLTERGLARAAELSWEETSRMTLESLRKAIGPQLG